MGISVIPAPSAGGKILKKLTLTGGSSWTVPSGVSDINVTLYGGGAGGVYVGHSLDQTSAAGAGGTTTFSGATSAQGGSVGTPKYTNTSNNGNSATPNTGQGATGMNPGSSASPSHYGYDGQVISSTLTVSAGSSIAYSIGAGGSAAVKSNGETSGSGGSGKIEIEYWV